MTLIVILLFVHCLLDFCIQGKLIAENKAKSYFVLFIHAFVLGAGVWLARYFYDGNQSHLWLIALIISHGITDRWKMSHMDWDWGPRNLVDQGIHFATILLFAVSK